jgi:hypothetical protein
MHNRCHIQPRQCCHGEGTCDVLFSPACTAVDNDQGVCLFRLQFCSRGKYTEGVYLGPTLRCRGKCTGAAPLKTSPVRHAEVSRLTEYV